MATEIPVSEIRALLAQATPGPWYAGAYSSAFTADDEGSDPIFSVRATHGDTPDVRSDLDMLVALRNHAPALLDAAEERDRLQDEVPYPYCPECEDECRSVDEEGCCAACGCDPTWPTWEIVKERDALAARVAALEEGAPKL